MSTTLYTPEILRLSTLLAAYPRLGEPAATVERRSPICGSRVTVDVVTDAAGRVTAFGIDARACALGQAAAALVAQHVIGRTAAEVAAAGDALRAFLAGARDDPGDWPGVAVFVPARANRARHASILLAFDATAEAAATTMTAA